MHGPFDDDAGEFAIEFQSSDRFSTGVNHDYEFLARPFTIIPGARIPVGGYEFTTGRIGYNFGQQRPLSGNVLFERGPFYNGDRTAIAFSRGRLNVSPQLSFEPSVAVNWIDTGTLPLASMLPLLAPVTPSLAFLSALPAPRARPPAPAPAPTRVP